MGDGELRKILEDIITDIEEGRVRPLPIRRGLLRRLGPGLLAASLGAGAAGCLANDGITPPGDAAYMAPDVIEVQPVMDAAYMAPFDAGPYPEYMAPMDGGMEDGGMKDGGMEDDGGSTTLDASLMEDLDGGVVPPYMGPPPP